MLRSDFILAGASDGAGRNRGEKLDRRSFALIQCASWCPKASAAIVSCVHLTLEAASHVAKCPRPITSCVFAVGIWPVI